MELKIEFGSMMHKGIMTLCVDRFLDMCNMKDFKKLLNLIDTSYTPEARDVLKEYITEYLAKVDDELKNYANNIVNARTEYKEQQPSLDALIKSRDRYKKNTEPYKEGMEKVKQQREKMRNIKYVWKSNEREFYETLKRKECYQKYLALLDQ